MVSIRSTWILRSNLPSTLESTRASDVAPSIAPQMGTGKSGFTLPTTHTVRIGMVFASSLFDRFRSECERESFNHWWDARAGAVRWPFVHVVMFGLLQAHLGDVRSFSCVGWLEGTLLAWCGFASCDPCARFRGMCRVYDVHTSSFPILSFLPRFVSLGVDIACLFFFPPSAVWGPSWVFHGPRLGGVSFDDVVRLIQTAAIGREPLAGGRSSLGETQGEGIEQARHPCASDRRDRGTGWSDPPSTFHKQPRGRCGSIPCIVRGVDVTAHSGSPPTVLTRRNGGGRRGRENT